MLSRPAFFRSVNVFNIPFEYTGIDINLQKHIEVLKYTFIQKHQDNLVNLIEQNSLKYLKNCSDVFDIIMIDGDHNYRTVIEELSHLRTEIY